MPFGFHGVFAALTGGVVFGAAGLRAGGAARRRGARSQDGSVARDHHRDGDRRGALRAAPARDDRRRSIRRTSRTAGRTRSAPIASAYGAWYTLALAVGAGWLAKVLLVDAIISPAGTGVVYVGTSARLSYALGEEREMPSALARPNKKGVPVVSILGRRGRRLPRVRAVQELERLVEVVTGATAIMYAFAPLSLAALHRSIPIARARIARRCRRCSCRPRSARRTSSSTGAASTPTWKLAVRDARRARAVRDRRGRTSGPACSTRLRHGAWMVPWLGGHVILGGSAATVGARICPTGGISAC